MEENFAVERRLKAQKLRRKARRFEVAVRRIFLFIRFLFVLFIFYCIYRMSFVKFWYLPQDTFTKNPPENIEIMGNRIVSTEKILNLLKDTEVKHRPIYRFNPEELSNKITELSPIKTAYVRRFWLPARLVIMIEEVNPVITISPSEDAPDVLAFAQTGERIGREFLPLNPNLNTVRVLTYGTQGDDYHNWDKDKIMMIYNLANAIKQYSSEKVLYIDLRNPNSVLVQLENVKIKLGRLDNSAFERVKEIHNILPAIEPIQSNVKYVDLSWDTKFIKMKK